MGLDVFEVRTGSLGRPRGTAYGFAWRLAAEKDDGHGDMGWPLLGKVLLWQLGDEGVHVDIRVSE